MLSSAMDSPKLETVPLSDYIGLQDQANATMVDEMWSKLRDYFKSNKEDADEFWWQTAVDDPDRILERFLLGSNRVVTAAVSALITTLKWRREYKVRDLIYKGENREDLIPKSCFESGKGIFWGYDKNGYLVIYLYPRKHIPSWFVSNRQNQNHIVYQTELGRRLFRSGRDKVTVLIDLEGLSMWSMDINCAIFVASSLRYYYPEAINEILLINMNPVYHFLYSMVRPMVEFIVKKLREVENKKDLVNVFDSQYLLSEFGGESKYKYEYVPPTTATKEIDNERFGHLQETANITALGFYETGDPELKRKLCQIYKQLDQIIYPGDLYSRIGVIDSDRNVKWK